MTPERPKPADYIVVEDGLITRTGSASQGDFLAFHVGLPGIRLVDDYRKFTLGDLFVDGASQPRPAGTARQVGSNVVGLPVPCRVQIDAGDPEECSDGIVEMDHAPPGTYILTVTSPRTLPQMLEVVIP